MSADKGILVRLVDDDEAMLEGLAFVLENEGWRVACYKSAEDFLVNDAPSVPGCLILDINMPEMSGLELQQTMLERGYNLPIIFLTGHGNIDLAVQTIRGGAVEFLEKTGDTGKLIQAVSAAVARSQKGFANLGIDPFEAHKRLSALTERELTIVRMIAAGQLNRQIAARLAISVRTVETHRAAAMKKLAVKTAAELITLLNTAP